MDFENTLSTVDETGAAPAVDAGADTGADNGTDAGSSQSEIVVMQVPAQTSPEVQQSTMLDPPTLESAGLPYVVRSVFGNYHQRTQTVTTVEADGSTTSSIEPVHGLAGLDWYWLSGVFLFTIVLWSFFRFLGVVFKR